MAFEKNTAYEEKIAFKNNSNSKTFEFPKGNFYAAMDLDINLNIDIATAVAATPLTHQIARCIEQLTIMRDGEDVVWQMSGEELARIYRYREGVEAAGNAALDVTVAAGKAGRMFLHIPFHPLDAPVPKDFAMDTNQHKYELKIRFRDVTAANTLFVDVSTGGCTVTVNESDSYIDLTLHKISPVKGPTGDVDQWQKKPPYFLGLVSNTTTIAATKTDQKIDLPENKFIRGVLLHANSDAASGLNPTGSNSIFTDRLELRNTQGRVIQNIKASTLRELTSLKRRDNGLENGLYEFDMTEFGNITDSVFSDGVAPLYIKAAVAKLTYDTRITSVVQTIERQGGR